jgi:hypothetical protein
MELRQRLGSILSNFGQVYHNIFVANDHKQKDLVLIA